MLNRDNLAKLATYLESLPADYEAFEMSEYLDITRSNPERAVEYALENGGVHNCGAVACAVGHGPSAGILFTRDELSMLPTWDGTGRSALAPDWNAYCRNNFVAPLTPEWEWMFGGDWSHVDNTPHGAAKRIRWLLAGNTPPTVYDHWEDEDIDFDSAYATEEHVELYNA